MAPLIPIALEIAKLAGPGLVKWLSGSDKAAETAGELISVAQQVTGAQSPEGALAALKAKPDLVLQLQIRSIEVEAGLTQAYLADRQDARKMAVEVAKAGGFDRKNVMLLGAVVGLLTCLGTLIGFRGGELPGEVVGIVSTISGIFGACLRDAFQFEFGSSRGSLEKTQLLARSQPIE